MYREEKIATTAPVIRVMELVQSIWEDQDSIEQFFMTPNAELGGKTPLEAARTEDGAEEVETLVRRLAARRPG